MNGKKIDMINNKELIKQIQTLHDQGVSGFDIAFRMSLKMNTVVFLAGTAGIQLRAHTKHCIECNQPFVVDTITAYSCKVICSPQCRLQRARKYQENIKKENEIMKALKIFGKYGYAIKIMKV